ncbi:MAG: peptidase T [Spirochaetaceae bacterium]|jgi:tripeptide aminopeptidase|nr:peptidase T [Spirochaetaceae bacterium]
MSAIFDDASLQSKLEERLIRYAGVWTTSDKRCEDTPTTAGQWDLARLLEKELRALGLQDIELTEHCYLIARLPSTVKESAHAAALPVIGFLSHLDTSAEVSGKDVHPIVERNYDGRIIELADGVTLDPAEDAELAAQKGRALIHTDGGTLLGADDKAGIAEIVSAAEYFSAHPEIEHPALEFIFSPDEETGKGLPCFPQHKIHARYCYTLDGGGAPEIEAECFNAYSVDVYFSGKVIHPGAARGVLVNAALMAATFAAMLPRSESPEATDGYYGYYCLMELSGNQESAHAELIVRDFSREGMERRLGAIEAFARAVEAEFPGGTARVEAKLSYINMKEKIDGEPAVLEKLFAAGSALGLELKLKPIRGGTDGARLSELGIPTPNIWTGGRRFHSKTEWVSLDDMVLAVKLVVELAHLWVPQALSALDDGVRSQTA